MTSSEASAAPAGDRDHDDVVLEISRAIEAVIHAQVEVGIHVMPPCGQIHFDLELRRVRIGWIAICEGGLLRVAGCEGLTLEQRGELARQAMKARIEGPRPSVGWRAVDGVGTVVSIYQRL